MMKLTTNRNYKAVAGAVFAFLVCAGSFVPTPVYAEFGAAELWSLVNAGLVSSPAVTSLKNSVVEQYTSLSPGELTMLEYEVGAVFAVGSVVLAQDWASSNGVEYDISNGCFTLTGLTRYINENNLTTTIPASFMVSDKGAIMNTDVGGFGCLPVVLNGNTASASYWTAGSGSRSYIALSFSIPASSSDFQASFSSYGVVDTHNGVGTFRNIQCLCSVGGYIRDNYWEMAEWLRSPVEWYNNYSVFTQNSSVDVQLNYCTLNDFDDITNPIDLYNQAYAKALEDYPEYIDNWVDLEDDFNATEPAVFDSLEFPPYIPNVDFHDVEVPTETLPTGLTDGAGFWFSAFSNMVDAFNLKPYVILFLCIMLVMVILKI